MVSFLRDVMIVVAILATLIAVALYPGAEHGPAHGTTAPVEPSPTAPAGPGAAGVEAVTPRFEQPVK